ncbi:hypothetical protein K8S17_01460 [bacterium]|nr:hypothetical protein [bacterium]
MRELSWTAWPMQRNPVRAVIGLAFIALVAWTLQGWLNTGYFTIFAVLLLWSQVAGFYLPTRHELTSDTVTVRGIIARREKSWSDFRSYFVDRDGVLLSPFIGRSRLERFRGLSLQFHDNRDEVIAFVEEKLGVGGEEKSETREREHLETEGPDKSGTEERDAALGDEELTEQGTGGDEGREA